MSSGKKSINRDACFVLKRVTVCVIVCCALLLCVSCATVVSDLSAGFNLVVVLPEKPTLTEKFAADELIKYLKKITGRKIHLKKVSDVEENDFTFSVGKTPFAKKYIGAFDSSPASTGHDSFIIETTDSSVVLIGGSDRGTLYAVYDFLESQGCRWFFPGSIGEVVPEKVGLRLTRGVVKRVPDFVQRELDIGAMKGLKVDEIIDWMAKNRLNMAFALRYALIRKHLPKSKWDAWRKRGGQMKWQWIAHNLCSFIVPASKYYKTHPEYFALYKGRRIPPGSPGHPGYGGGNLCTTNPEVIKICAKFAIDWFAKHPDGVVVPLWPGDGAIKWCECSNCKKLGGRNFFPGKRGSMTKRMVVFANAVAKIVAEKYPDRFILCPAYSNYVMPVDIPLEKNVLVQYCVHGCYAHGLDKCEPNAKEMRMVLDWSKKAFGRMGVWEYFLLGNHHSKNLENKAMLPVLHRTRDSMAFYTKHGVNWYFTQASPKYWKHNIFAFYQTARLAWNADQDFDAMLEDFCSKFYGSAGPMVRDFYRLIENQVDVAGWHPQTYADVASPSPAVFTPDLLRKCESLLKKAESEKLNVVMKKRLSWVRDTFNYIKMNVGLQGTLGLNPNSPWRIKRGKRYYTINPDGKALSDEDVKSLIWYAKDTGSYNRDFKRLLFRARKRTVPIVFIENDTVRVGVIPELGGRIIRLIDKRTNRNFMKERFADDGLKKIGSTYFNYGGYEEYAGKAFASLGWEIPYSCEKRETGKILSLTLTADVDGLELKRVVSVRKGKDPEVSIVSTLTNKTGETVKATLRAHPMFTLGADSANCLVERKLKDGRWKRTTLQGESDNFLPDTKGELLVGDPENGAAIRDSYDPALATPYICKTTNDSFTMELFSKERNLKPGESLVLSHKYAILNDFKITK